MNQPSSPLSDQEVETCRQLGQNLLDNLDTILLGQKPMTRAVVIAALAGGHVLLEGLPGLGKTELVKGLARLLAMEFRRVQFTPDLLPGDITGGHILQETENGNEFVFRPGPVFCNLLLADEINRASPKTQSALLEAMAEARVTVLGETRDLPDPFFVLATQNPIEMEGTYPLPEAQLDRFLFKVQVPSVNADVLAAIIGQRQSGRPPECEAVASAEDFRNFRDAAQRMHFPPAVISYAARLCAATHPGNPEAPKSVQEFVRYGASPRAAIAIADAARVDALLQGKPTIGFDNIKTVAPFALCHRLVLDYRAKIEGVTSHQVVADLLASVEELEHAMPKEVIDADA
ncbi:MAG: AAA family ATPase [Planctomycetota bacterium]|nr:MAG: AAA family ATPase [Planctomycetota bacterium]